MSKQVDRPSILRRRVLNWASRLTSGRVKTQLFREMSTDFVADGDAIDPGVPNGVDVEIAGFWISEFVTPSTSPRFSDRVDAHPWSSSGRDEGIGEWLSEARSGYGRERTFRIYAPGDPRSIAASVVLPLPEFADSAYGRLATVTASVTRVTIFFTMKETARRGFAARLHAAYARSIEQRRDAVAFFEPEDNRRRALNEFRGKWRREASRWMASHFPGILSDRGGLGVPTCELAVIDGFTAFDPPGSADPEHPSFKQALGMAFTHLVFEDPESEGVSFAADAIERDGLEGHSILAVSRRRFTASVAMLGSKTDAHRFATHVHDEFRDTFSKWSLLALVTHFEREVARIRDQAHQLVHRRLGLRALQRVQRRTVGTVDAVAIGRELTEYSEVGAFSTVIGLNLERQRWRPRGEAVTFNQFTRSALELRAKGLRPKIAEVNDYLSQQANLLNALSSLRLGYIVGVVGFVAAAAAVLALEPVQHWLGWQSGPTAPSYAEGPFKPRSAAIEATSRTPRPARPAVARIKGGDTPIAAISGSGSPASKHSPAPSTGR